MRSMQRLSTSFNRKASDAVEKAKSDAVEKAKSDTVKKEESDTVESAKNDPTEQQNDLEAAVEGDELGRDVTSVAINHLFGDLAFFCRDSLLQQPDVAFHSDSVEYANLKVKLSKLHILDGLDYLNDNTNTVTEETRSGMLREYVQQLKGMLPTNYDEAWNHSDENFRVRWRAAI